MQDGVTHGLEKKNNWTVIAYDLVFIPSITTKMQIMNAISQLAVFAFGQQPANHLIQLKVYFYCNPTLRDQSTMSKTEVVNWQDALNNIWFVNTPRNDFWEKVYGFVYISQHLNPVNFTMCVIVSVAYQQTNYKRLCKSSYSKICKTFLRPVTQI